MKKYIVIGGGILSGLLGGLTGAKAQVNVIFKNASSFGFNLYVSGAYVDSVPANSQTTHLRFRKINNKDISIVAQNGIYPLNFNPDSTHTQGSFVYTIVWDNKKKIYSAILKPL